MTGITISGSYNHQDYYDLLGFCRTAILIPSELRE